MSKKLGRARTGRTRTSTVAGKNQLIQGRRDRRYKICYHASSANHKGYFNDH